MRNSCAIWAGVGAVVTGLCCNSMVRESRGASVTAKRVATGLSSPVFAGSPVGDLGRLFVVEQHTGQIKILQQSTGQINAVPFLDLDGMATGGEQGLLGLAFHPNYADNGKFYVNLTIASGRTEIREYTVSGNPDVADANSGRLVMAIDQPFENHNGGWMDFGPNDGYLYIATGDGGDANDPGHRAQDITDQKLGKMLRIDVDGDNGPGGDYGIPNDNPFVGQNGDDEIWASGLRNPWRNSFDRETGDLYIADVGQQTREEVDFQAADSAGGENYGWRVVEGTFCANPSRSERCDDPQYVPPIHEYGHSGGPNGGFAITGGYVYRGEAMPYLDGTYFFGDYITEQIWTFRFDGATKTEFQNRTTKIIPDVGSIDEISSFGEDGAGELYIVDLGGQIFKLMPLWGDTDDDGLVDLNDLNNVRNNFGGSGIGDTNFDGIVDLNDLNNVRNSFSAGPISVPEPVSGISLVIGTSACLAGREMRRRRRP